MKHCLIKMNNGEDVIGRFIEEDTNTLIVEDAMVVDVEQHDKGTSIYVTRWVPFTDDKLILINKRSITSILSLRESMADYYEQCVDSYYKRFESDFDEQLASDETVEFESASELEQYMESIDEKIKKSGNTVH